MSGFITGQELLELVPREERGFELLEPSYTPIQKAVMPVIGWTGRRLIPYGTCFSISPRGIVLTAWHVIQDFVEKYGAATHQGDAGLYVLLETDEQLDDSSQDVFGGLLPVVSYAEDGETDVCAMKVAFPKGRHLELPAIAIDVGIPATRAKCCAVGYPKMALDGEDLRREITVEASSEVDYKRQLAVSTGEIAEVHLIKRDPSFLKFPSFMTTAHFDSGMSGGPVIIDNGLVCGMVCAGFDLDGTEQDIGSISYASLLAPVLRLSVVQSDGSAKKLAQLDIDEAICATGHDELDTRKAPDGTWLWYRDSRRRN